MEGNFFQNVDYDAAFERGVNVVACMPAYAQAVAEFSLGLAIDLARGITREDRAFREGREGYVFNSTQDAILLRGATMGILGYGNIGRKLLPLLEPFRPSVVRCYDPWLPDAVIREAGMQPASLEEVLAGSTFLFVLATVTDESTHLLNAENMQLIPRGARVVLSSRAAVVDFDAMVGYVDEGRFLAATDVWPEEPAPRDHPLAESKTWCCRHTVPAASRPPSSRSVRWSSMTWRCWRRACPRCVTSWRHVSS